MSALVRLSSRLPGEIEVNGLDALVEHFTHWDGPICSIVWLETEKVTRGRDQIDVPTVVIARIEPIGTLDQVPTDVVNLVARLYEARVGRAALPFAELAAMAVDAVSQARQALDEALDGEDIAPHQGRTDVTTHLQVFDGGRER